MSTSPSTWSFLVIGIPFPLLEYSTYPPHPRQRIKEEIDFSKWPRGRWQSSLLSLLHHSLQKNGRAFGVFHLLQPFPGSPWISSDMKPPGKDDGRERTRLNFEKLWTPHPFPQNCLQIVNLEMCLPASASGLMAVKEMKTSVHPWVAPARSPRKEQPWGKDAAVLLCQWELWASRDGLCGSSFLYTPLGDHEEGAPGLGLIGSRNWAECGQRSPLLSSFGLSGSLEKSNVAVPAFLTGPLVFPGVWDE